MIFLLAVGSFVDGLLVRLLAAFPVPATVVVVAGRFAAEDRFRASGSSSEDDDSVGGVNVLTGTSLSSLTIVVVVLGDGLDTDAVDGAKMGLSPVVLSFDVLDIDKDDVNVLLSSCCSLVAEREGRFCTLSVAVVDGTTATS